MILMLIGICASVGAVIAGIQFLKYLTGPDDPNYDYPEYKKDGHD